MKAKLLYNTMKALVIKIFLLLKKNVLVLNVPLFVFIIVGVINYSKQKQGLFTKQKPSYFRKTRSNSNLSKIDNLITAKVIPFTAIYRNLLHC